MSVRQHRDHDVIPDTAGRLAAAERDRIPVPPISQVHPGLTVEDAYGIQQVNVRRRLDRGDRIVGYKVGLTSRAMQELLGVDEPDYAPILSSMLLGDGAAISRGALIQPKAEAEIAVVLEKPLRGPGVTEEDVRRATLGVAPAIELIDSRIRDWKITLVDTIADMASSALVVVGAPKPLEGIDPPSVEVALERNGTVAATGTGSAVLGNPLRAVAWAANTLGPLGETMRPGHFIMPGALHAAIPAEAGDAFVARFGRLGSVHVRFEP